MLKPITVRSRTAADGALDIRVPTGISEADVDVVIVVHPVDARGGASGPETSGWPGGFFEKTFGSLRNAGLERHPQGDHEPRDPGP